MSRAEKLEAIIAEKKWGLFYVEWSSIFNSAPYYQKDKIAQVLKDAGFTDVHYENSRGWSNQPAVVVFRGDPEKAKEALMDAGDSIHPLVKKWGVIISSKDWKQKKESFSKASKLSALAEEDTSYYVVADPKEAEKIAKSGKDDKALFKGTVKDAEKYAKEKMKGKDAVLLKRNPDGKFGYAVGEAKAKKEHEFSGSNLYFKGIDRDMNGNRIARFSFPNGRAFSIQTGGNLPSFHKLWKGEFDVTPAMEKEVIDYIQNYGSANQKSGLRVYNKEESKGGNAMSRAKELQKVVESAAVNEMYALGADHIVNWMKKVAYERFDVDPATISVVPWPQDGSDFNINTPLTKEQYEELSEKLTRTYPLYVVEFAGEGIMKFYSRRTVGTEPANTEELYPRENPA